MISLTFHRESVCMGDDAGNGVYTLEMPDGATLGDLLHVLLYGGYGNDWPIPYTGANSVWSIDSNIGILAKIYTDADGEWHIESLVYPETTPLRTLGVTRTFGGRGA